MTGLIQCLLPTAASAVAPNDPFHRLLLEAAVLLSNTLPSTVLAAVGYALWHPYDVGSKLLPAGVVLCVATCICLMLKFTIGMRHGSALPAECCLGYVLSLDYSLPSVHAMGAVLLGIYLSEPYWLLLRPLLITQPDEEAQEEEPEKPVDPALLKDARIRLALIWIYVVALCYARLVLRLNGLLDVLLGALIGVSAFASAHLLLRWLAGAGGGVGVKNE
jgi:membrane-associated phospholipid phosphatase